MATSSAAANLATNSASMALAKGKSNANSHHPSEASLKRKRGLFTKELRIMMYGFGDDPDQARKCGDLNPSKLKLEASRLKMPKKPGQEWDFIEKVLSRKCWAPDYLHLMPLPETVSLVEDIMVDYVTEMVHKAQDIASRRGKLTTEDLMFLVRKDSRKFARVKELLAMNEELKRARKAFEVDEEKLAALD
ncbi:hypothetical protein KP509_01G070500 [Ceratopteris richardii]|uniref:Transcription initiation factor TFIID subunit 13 n=1 Tax=Ceratopteris richardii TaxID=49495 RepID=A0A8T2VHB3_CERRI|nr:hypothetical protein KP509_01G070500 [Ceratopteris richardii]